MTPPQTQRRSQTGKPGMSGRNKPRARLVCFNCRQRKIKCDAEKIAPGQRCTHCTNSDTPCVLNRVDGRRKSRHHDSALHARLQYLENLVAKEVLSTDQIDVQNSNSAVASAMNAQCDAESITLSMSRNQGDGNAQPPSQTVEVHNLGGSIDRHPSPTCISPSSMEERRYSTAVVMPATNQYGASPERAPARSVNHPLETDTSLPTKRLDLNPTPGVSTNSAAVPETGADYPYYGPTTQAHVRSRPDGALLTELEEDIAPNMPLNIDSFPLRRTIINLYFSLQPRFQPLVDQEVFLRDRACGERTRYYSTFLEDALLAFATRHSTSSAVRKLGARYAERCKSQISMELDNPNLASVSGFLLLGDFEAGRGRARIGWSYCVIASSLITDLGLHVDLSDAVKRGKITAHEAKIRYTLLLCIFVYSVLWSLYLGRPSPLSQLTLHSIRRVASQVSNSWVGFCQHVLDIIDILNEPAALSGLTSVTLSRLLELDSDLCSFVHQLYPAGPQPEEMEADSYAMRMQFCGIRILLHRSILNSDMVPYSIPDGTSHDRSVSVSRDHLYASIHDNAVHISELIFSYYRIYGIQDVVTVMIDNIFIACVALISHVHRSSQTGRSADKAIHWLQFLSRTLQATTKHFPVAFRMQNYLASIVENSSLSSFFPRYPVRSQSTVTDGTLGMICTPPMTLDTLEPRSDGLMADESLLSNFDFTTLDDNDGMWLSGLAWNLTPLTGEGAATF